MASKSSNVRVLPSKIAEVQKETVHLVNPVEDLWNVELLYGRHHSFSEPTYGLYMKSKLIGEGSRCFLLVDIHLETIDDILYTLNVFGLIERKEFLRVLDYAKQLKRHGVFRGVPDLLPYIEGEAHDHEGEELYQLMREYVIENIHMFPSVMHNMYEAGQYLGVELDSDVYIKKYGSNIVGVTTEAIIEALALEGNTKTRIIEITRSWLKLGVLIKRSSQSRLQESIRPCEDSREIKRFYLLHIEGLHEA